MLMKPLGQFLERGLLCECDLVGCDHPGGGKHGYSCSNIATQLVANPHVNHGAALCADCARAWRADDTYSTVYDLDAVEEDETA